MVNLNPFKSKSNSNKPILGPLPEDKIFKLEDGTEIRSFKDLPEAFKKMNDKIFNSHLNKEKNDFANWIEHVLKDPILADDIKYVYNKKEAEIIADSRLKELSKKKETKVKKAAKKTVKKAKEIITKPIKAITKVPKKEIIAKPTQAITEAPTKALDIIKKPTKAIVKIPKSIYQLIKTPTQVILKVPTKAIDFVKKAVPKKKKASNKKVKEPKMPKPKAEKEIKKEPKMPKPEEELIAPKPEEPKKEKKALFKIKSFNPFKSKKKKEKPEPTTEKEVTPKEVKEEEPKIDVTQKIKIEIPGFPEILPEGIPRGTATLLGGGPGTGKTTFCLSLMNYLGMEGEKCLYLTFEENEDRLRNHMKSFGFNPNKLEADGNLKIVRMNPFQISRSVEALLAEASGELLIKIDRAQELLPKGYKPTVLILDSLSAVSAAFAGKEAGYRIYAEQLFRALEKLNITSFLISEVEEGSSRYSQHGVEEFLADGIISFYNIFKDGDRLSALEIVKMRGVSHKKKVVPMEILAGTGIIVYPGERIFVEQLIGKPK